MISGILSGLCDQITAHTPGHIVVQLANIATLTDDDAAIEDKAAIVLSIVNIEEDKAMKNQSIYREPNKVTGEIERYKKPAQNLILSVLFTSFNKDNTMYLSGMDKLEEVIRFIQSNNVYYYRYDFGLKEQTDPTLTPAEKENSDKIILDMVSLKTDQANQLWSYLGSKYMTSVLYSLRIIYIQSDKPADLIKQGIITSAGLELVKKVGDETEIFEEKEIPMHSPDES